MGRYLIVKEGQGTTRRESVEYTSFEVYQRPRKEVSDSGEKSRR